MTKKNVTRRKAATWLAGAVGSVFAARTSFANSPLNLPALTLKPFSLPALSGLDGIAGFDLETLKGQVTVLNFWGSWCGPCQTEHPRLQALREKNIRLIGVNAFDPNAKDAVAFLKKEGNPFLFVGVDPKKGGLCEMLGIDSIPQTFVIGRQAEVLWQTGNTLDEHEFQDLLGAVQATAI